MSLAEEIEDRDNKRAASANLSSGMGDGHTTCSQLSINFTRTKTAQALANVSPKPHELFLSPDP